MPFLNLKSGQREYRAALLSVPGNSRCAAEKNVKIPMSGAVIGYLLALKYPPRTGGLVLLLIIKTRFYSA